MAGANMTSWLDYSWRLFATGLSFSAFGLGALLITASVFPAIHLLSFNRRRANAYCQYIVHLSFRLFIWLMKTLGVLTYEIDGAEKLSGRRPNLVIANHPSLIDVVFIISLLPTSLCVVKKAAWSNPFLMGVMRATGYIQNDNPMQLIDDCVQGIAEENNLLIFPEATRTVPGRPIKLKRGAASVINKSKAPFVPIIITCDPSTLTKAERWYEIPSRRVHFKITVGDEFDPQPLLIDNEELSRANRRVNRSIREIFLTGIEEHGQTSYRAKIFTN